MSASNLQTTSKKSWKMHFYAILVILLLLALACQNPLESSEAKQTRVAEAVQLTLLADKLATVEAQQTALSGPATSVVFTDEPRPATAAPPATQPLEPTREQQANATPTEVPTEAPTPTLTPTQPAALRDGDTKQWPVDGMTTVYVSAGEFRMGSDDKSALASEKPAHRVILDAFWIDKTEVSNAMYARCVADGACTDIGRKSTAERKAYHGAPEYDDFPVIYVSWEQAKSYCEWAGRRLPTEAEWEKAARGVDGRTYPWGNEAPTCSLAHTWGFNYYDSWNENVGQPLGCSSMPTAVDSLPAGASPYGALHMAGNVSEWVADWYMSGYYASSPDNNPEGPASGTQRVVRGRLGYFQITNEMWLIYQDHRYNYGEFRFDIRVTAREYYKPSYLFHDLGIRCAANP